MTRARFAVAALALALTATLTGCFAPGPGPTPGPDPVETESPAEAGLGVPIRVVQADGVGELVIHSATYGQTVPGETPLEFPNENGGFLYLTATWTSLEGTTHALVIDWAAEDASGTPGGAFILLDDPLNVVDLPAGESVDGEIAFDIGAGPYTFVVFDDGQNEVARFTFEAGTH